MGVIVLIPGLRSVEAEFTVSGTNQTAALQLVSY